MKYVSLDNNAKPARIADRNLEFLESLFIRYKERNPNMSMRVSCTVINEIRLNVKLNETKKIKTIAAFFVKYLEDIL